MSDENDTTAFCLANTYGFCPPVPEPTSIDRDVDTGMFEPDSQEGEENRFFVLAQPLNGTNILTKFIPGQLELFP